VEPGDLLLQMFSRALSSFEAILKSKAGNVAGPETSHRDNRVVTLISCVTFMSGCHGSIRKAETQEKPLACCCRQPNLLATTASALEGLRKKYRM
jgi:hypothetical protein